MVISKEELVILTCMVLLFTAFNTNHLSYENKTIIEFTQKKRDNLNVHLDMFSSFLADSVISSVVAI